jgi:GDP-4-dehydro-6-deoxy-D-mannose reductase
VTERAGRVLVTGVTGFVGRHLVELLRAQRPPLLLYGLARARGDLVLPRGVHLVEADLEDAGAVEAALERARPDRIFHLAGRSSVQQSFADPAGTLRTNVHGLLNLLEAVRRSGGQPRILIVGSADEYGAVEAARLPISEATPLNPRSPYAVSKMAQGFLARQYALSFGMQIVRTRTFPHTGPGRGEVFAESSFARQIAEIEMGHRPPVVEVGNLEAVRDFTDVRDVVRGYWALCESGATGEVYNVCSGCGVRIGALLEKLIALARVRVEVRQDASRLRPADIPALVGDPARLRAATGWTPSFSLDDTLRDLLDDWRRRLAEGVAPAPASA